MNVTSVVTNEGTVFTAFATLGSGTYACTTGQPIAFTFQSVEQFATTSSGGVASVTFLAPSVPGLYTISAFFSGTPSCDPSSAVGQLSVPAPAPPPAPSPTTLTVQNASALPGGAFTATATLASGSSACFSDEPISFTLQGQPPAIAITNASGVASVILTAPIAGGTFPIQASFMGTASCGASSGIGDLSVVPTTASLTVLSMANVSVPGGSLFTVAATLKPGFCGVGQGVVFTFPAQNVQVITTTERNLNATASFIAPSVPGTYLIQAAFEGSPNPSPGCLPSSASAQLTVTPPAPTTLTVANVGVQTAGFFTATATLGPKSCALGQSVTFAFNGATRTGITNLSGMAGATFIAPGTPEILPVEAFFGGTPTCAANSASATVTVRGSTAPAGLGLSPLSLSFGPQPIGSSSSPLTIELANNSRTQLKVASIAINNNSKTSPPAFIEADSCLPVVAPESACSIRVSFTPSATGSQSAMLAIKAGSHIQQVPLSGTGILAATVSPTKLSFGNQKANTISASKTVSVANNLGTRLSFDNFFVDGDFAITSNGCTGGVGAHSTCAIEIAFKPAVTGALTGSLTIGDTASSVPLTVSLTGTGH